MRRELRRCETELEIIAERRYLSPFWRYLYHHRRCPDTNTDA